MTGINLSAIIEREELKLQEISNYEKYKEYYKDWHKNKRTEESRKEAHRKFVASFESYDAYLEYCRENNKKHRLKLKMRNSDNLSDAEKDELALKNAKSRLDRETDVAGNILARAKTRAKKLGREFSITREDIFIPEYCPVLGVKLEMNEGRQAANSHSIDRIDNNKGYIPGNVRIISQAANAIKGNSSLEELEAVIDYIKSA